MNSACKIFFVAASAFAAAAFAQTTEPPAPGEIPPEIVQRTTVVPQRLGLFLGREVFDQADNRVGTVVDIVLDGTLRRVSYVVITHPGEPKSIDKLFAIPWGDVEYRQSEPKKIFIKISTQTLDNAPAFSPDVWPDFSQPEYRRRLSEYYNLEATLAPGDGKNSIPWTRRVRDILGAQVNSVDGRDVGQIKDLIVDTSAAQVKYAVLAFPSVFGEKLFPVPLRALRSTRDKPQFAVDIPRERFKNAPGFDSNSWPDWTSRPFIDSVDQLYEAPAQESR